MSINTNAYREHQIMDIKQFRQHLAKVSAQKASTITESAASSSAQKLSQRLDEFERASKNLLDAWDDAIDTINDDNITHTAGYPFDRSFDEVVPDIKKFVSALKSNLRTLK